MVNPGEKVTVAAVREFLEEAQDSAQLTESEIKDRKDLITSLENKEVNCHIINYLKIS